MRQTIKSRCPVCEGVLESVKVIYGVKAMMACPHCATMVELDTEEISQEAPAHREHSKLKRILDPDSGSSRGSQATNRRKREVLPFEVWLTRLVSKQGHGRFTSIQVREAYQRGLENK